MNAFGVFYAGALSLVMKSMAVIIFIVGGMLRFFHLFGTNKKFINPNVGWIVKGPVIVIIVTGVVLYNWGVMTMLKGLCISNHNKDSPGFSIGNFGVTTALMRYYQDETCSSESKP